MKRWVKLVGVMGLLSVLSACDSEPLQETGSATPTIKQAQQALVDSHIIPAAKSFEASAQAFVAQSNTICQSDFQSKDIQDLQSSWNSLAKQWSRLEPFNFGPMNDSLFHARIDFINSYRKRGMDYSASVRTSLAKQMTAEKMKPVSSLTFNLTGLLALEILSYQTLFETSESIAEEFKQHPRRCELLNGHAQELLGQASYIVSGWETKFTYGDTAFSTLFLSGTLPNGGNALAELFVAMSSHLDYTKKRKVLSRTAVLSGVAFEQAEAMIQSIEEVVSGQLGATSSFMHVMQQNGHSKLVSEIKRHFQLAKEALSKRDQTQFEQALKLLEKDFNTVIPAALGVEMAINFSDGD